ncbi:MAG: hypothetical protein WCS65_09495 [Verrucomicrobiae bacterium]
MIIYRAIVWSENRNEWPKDDHQNNVAVYVSKDQRAVAAGSIELLLPRVQQASEEISTAREAMRLAYTFSTERTDKARPVIR